MVVMVDFEHSGDGYGGMLRDESYGRQLRCLTCPFDNPARADPLRGTGRML